MRIVETEFVAKGIQQRHDVRIGVNGMGLAVDGEGESVRRKRPSLQFGSGS
jgi:hypothetical protein